jgi:hypothetical protein
MEKEWEKMGKNGKIRGKNEGLTFSLDEPNCALDWVLCVELCSVLNYVMCWIVCWIFEELCEECEKIFEELCEECEKIFEELCVGFSRNCVRSVKRFSRNCVLDFRGIVWGVFIQIIVALAQSHTSTHNFLTIFIHNSPHFST